MRSIKQRLKISVEVDFSPYREEIGTVSSPEENDSHNSKVCSENNTGSKDFIQLPAVRQGGWLNSVLRDCHDSTCIVMFADMRSDAYTINTVEILVKKTHTHNIPSLRMAMIRTMKGAKSNFQIKAISKNPSCNRKLTLGWRESNIYILVEEMV
jgi:hypothetical protein